MQLRFEAHDQGRTEVVGCIFSWKPKGVIEQPMSDLLNAQGRPDSRGRALAFGVPPKLEPLLLVHLAHSKSSKTN
jgi:hypothetical protein